MTHIMRIDEFFNVFKKNNQILKKDNPLLKNFKFIDNECNKGGNGMQERLELFIELCQKEGFDVKTLVFNSDREHPRNLDVFLSKPVKSLPQAKNGFNIQITFDNDDTRPLYNRVGVELEVWMYGDGNLPSMEHLEEIAKECWEDTYKKQGASYGDVLNAHKEFAAMVEDLIEKMKKQDI